MLDTGYMHVVMNILSNGTPIDSYQSLFSMDTLTNTDMNMNIITHTWPPVIHLTPPWVVPTRLFGGTSTLLFGWSALDCCFVCGPYGSPFIGSPPRVFHIPPRLPARCSILAGHATRGCWTRSWTRRVWPGFCLHGFLKFLLIWKKLMTFKEHIRVYQHK